MEKFGLRLTGRRKCYFSIFAFSLFPNFKWLLSKIFQWISRFLSNFYYVKNIFDLQIFENEISVHISKKFKRVALLIFFEFSRDMHFVSLFFLNERNITISLLMIHLKCTAVHYANLNSSSINKPFLNYGRLNMLFRFFYFLFMFILMKLLSKNLWNNYHFLIQISKIHFKM